MYESVVATEEQLPQFVVFKETKGTLALLPPQQIAHF
jgi:hypothetical protein